MSAWAMIVMRAWTPRWQLARELVVGNSRVHKGSAMQRWSDVLARRRCETPLLQPLLQSLLQPQFLHLRSSFSQILSSLDPPPFQILSPPLPSH